MIEADHNSFIYEIKSLLNAFKKTVKFKIKIIEMYNLRKNEHMVYHIPVRVDDTHNINAEHEDVEANTEYDPNCCVKNNLDENEIKHNDEDIWYDTNDDDVEEPTFYDSGM